MSSNVDRLVDTLKEADQAYYVEGKPMIDNETYDALVASLRRLDPSHSYLSKVGHEVLTGSKVGRITPMGTLNKYHTEESVQQWVEGHKNEILLMAPKYDGFGCELDYDPVTGELLMASTRGNGQVGEDITESARNCEAVPKQVPPGLTKVRGEFIIPKFNHDVMKSLGYQAMRNAVPGIVRSNNSAISYVHFVAYEFFDGDTNRRRQRGKYKFHFEVEDIASFLENFQDMCDYRQQFNRDEYAYEIDGMVIKTDEIKEDDYSFPVHQIAWKFKSNRETTILRGIKANLGISGKFTPTALFDEVEFQGAKLTNASLGNYARVKNLDPKIGSLIEVSRRGDIIPYVESVSFTPDDAVDLERLTECPHCGEPITYRDDEPYCLNQRCMMLSQLRLRQYIGNVGVKGIGTGVITKLYDAGLVIELPDIYKLDPNVIAGLPGLGQSMVDKWVALQSKELTPLQFVTSLPFVDIGPAVWKKLLEDMTLRELLTITRDELGSKKLRGIGESKLETFVTQRDDLLDTIKELLGYVKMKG